MPMSQALLPEFDHEMANTRKALERVPEEKFGWKPHEKSMTLGRLATHVAELTGRSAAARSRSCYPHIGVRAQIRPTPVTVVLSSHRGSCTNSPNSAPTTQGQLPDEANKLGYWPCAKRGTNLRLALVLRLPRPLVWRYRSIRDSGFWSVTSS